MQEVTKARKITQHLNISQLPFQHIHALANALSFNFVSPGVTAARLEAIFDQPFPKPSHSTQLFLILPLLLFLHLLLLRLPVLLPLTASSQPTPWNLSPKRHRASVLVTISGNIRTNSTKSRNLIFCCSFCRSFHRGSRSRKASRKLPNLKALLFSSRALLPSLSR